MVRRILAAYYRPGSGDSGPSSLSFLGHSKDRLWRIDLSRCGSIQLKSHGVFVVMDQFTRRIVGFGVHTGDVDGIAQCHMFNAAISTQGGPHYLSSDNDPLFRYHRWQANLRTLEIQQIKTVPYLPLSHPFIERLIGTIHRELLDHMFFWNANDLERQLEGARLYCAALRVHTSLNGDAPSETAGATTGCRADLKQIPVEISLPRAISVTRGTLTWESATHRLESVVEDDREKLVRIERL